MSAPSSAVPIVTCGGGAPWEAPLVRGLARRELGVAVLRRCLDHGELLGVALRDRPRAAVLAAELPWLDRELVGTLHGHGVTVVAVEPPGTSRTLDRIGVDHRLPVDASAEDVAGVLHRLAAGAASAEGVRRPPPEVGAAGPAGTLVVCWGPGGAPGRTTVAVHLAIELSRAGDRVRLVDGDSWSASIAQALGLAEAPGLAQAAHRAARGDPTAVAECLQEGPGGIEVLAGLARAELWPEVREHAWTEVLDQTRAGVDVVVVDVAAPIEEDEELAFDRVPYRRNLMTLRALELASRVIVVTSADPVGLRRGILAHRALSDARPRLHADVQTVLNRVPASARRAQECSQAVAEWTERPPVAFLPPEPALAAVAWEGRPLHRLAPRSRWLRELRALHEVVRP